MPLVGQRVALPRRVARLYPAYGLYLYGEGLYAQESRALKLAGAPVLFLPGNAGSFKQGTCMKSMIEIMLGLGISMEICNQIWEEMAVFYLWTQSGAFSVNDLVLCAV